MDGKQRDIIRRAWPRQLVFTVVLAAAVFGLAGSAAYWQGWLFLFCFTGASLALGAYFLVHDPALIERRMKAGPAEEPEMTQKIIISLVLVGFLLLILMPALDYRWHGPAVAAWLSILADLGIVASFVIFFFVMEQNSYAAASVRVEAGQPVISTGLYGIVRHPMYSGALLLLPCIPLSLGSYTSLLLLVPFVPLLGWRAVDEEKVLLRDLPGYATYCNTVRYRLIPGIW
jgi:protein-S-isoprenylcysteine O-methyltransferase Ste14